MYSFDDGQLLHVLSFLVVYNHAILSATYRKGDGREIGSQATQATHTHQMLIRRCPPYFLFSIKNVLYLRVTPSGLAVP
jgi:hypothetical protein